MKNSLTYGFVLTVAGAILTLVLFFLGFNATPEKMETSKYISMVLGSVIAIVVLQLGMKDKRSQTPADKSWGYGSAFAAGFMISLFGALFGAIFHYVFFAYIDPGSQDVLWQAQRAALETKGMSADKIEQIEPMVRKWISPLPMAFFAFIGALVFNTVFSLIIAAFLKNRDTAQPPATA